MQGCTTLKTIKILLYGHPNVGKSVIFNELTGMNAIVSNYPGTTVEVYRGKLEYNGIEIEVIDAPGAYSIIPANPAESVARKIILEEKPDIIVHVVDATSLSRHLYLTLELMQFKIPIILALNQVDRLKNLGLKIDGEKLQKILKIPVVFTIAVEGKGLNKLKKTIINQFKEGRKPNPNILGDTNEIITNIENIVREALKDELKIFSRAIAYCLLMGDKESPIINNLPKETLNKINENRTKLLSSVSTRAHEIGCQVTKTLERGILKIRPIDIHLVHPVKGVAIMTLLTLGIVWGTLLAIHEIAHRIPIALYFNLYDPIIRGLVESFIPNGLIHNLLVGEEPGIYSSMGLLTTGVFFIFFMILPSLIVLYLVLGLLEDIGFLPRLSIPYDRPLKIIGMSGESICPLITGSGCSIVGVFATRILGSDKERFIASVIQWFGIPCMAEQVMIWFVLGGYGPQYVLLLYLILLASVIVVGLILDKILPGEKSPLILEIPVWRKPKLSNILKKTVVRIKEFILKGIPLILLGITIVNILYYTGFIHMIAAFSSPIISGWFGLPEDVIAPIIIGILRKDVAVGVLQAVGEKLSALQTLTAVTILTLYFPCIGTLLITLYEFGAKKTIIMLIIMTIVTFTVGGILSLLSTLT